MVFKGFVIVCSWVLAPSVIRVEGLGGLRRRLGLTLEPVDLGLVLGPLPGGGDALPRGGLLGGGGAALGVGLALVGGFGDPGLVLRRGVLGGLLGGLRVELGLDPLGFELGLGELGLDLGGLLDLLGHPLLLGGVLAGLDLGLLEATLAGQVLLAGHLAGDLLDLALDLIKRVHVPRPSVGLSAGPCR